MRKRKTQKSLHQSWREDQSSTNDTVEILRRLNKSLKAHEEDAGGSRGFARMWQEMGYAGLWVFKMVLIIGFNLAAVFLIFWAISLI
jgi:hypothetical protein